MLLLRWRLLVALLFCCSVCDAQEADRPRIGLALSGGGTKGGAHVGVLKVLEAQGIKVDYIAGTSVGAIIGGMYASGMTPEAIEQVIAGIDWNDLLSDEAAREHLPPNRKRDDFNYLVRARPGFSGGQLRLPLGLAQGQKITQFLRSLFAPVSHIRKFDELPIPFRAVATSLQDHSVVVLEEGDLPLAIRSSMSIPGVFAPVDFDGVRLIDGGITNNLPIDVVRNMGADVVIAVDITAPYLDASQINSVVGVTQQLINFLTRSNVARQLQTLTNDDVLIAPDVSSIAMLDFGNTLSAMAPGTSAATEQSHRLARLANDSGKSGVPLLDEGQVSEQIEERAERRVRRLTPAREVIDFVSIDDDSGLSEQSVRSRLAIPLGKPFDRAQLESGISRLYATGLYERVDYELLEKAGAAGIGIVARAKSWGPNYLQLGMRLEEDFSADADFNLGIAYQRTAMDPLGAQWRTQLDLGAEQGIRTHWHQPLNPRGDYYASAEIGYESRNLRVFGDSETALADARVAGLGTTLKAGKYLNASTDLRLGWTRLFGTVDVTVGEFALPSEEFDIGEMSLTLARDSLSSIHRPLRGTQASVSVIASESVFGGTTDYKQLDGYLTKAFSFGHTVADVSVSVGTTFAGAAPVQSNFALGGLGRLSGYPVDRFFGQHLGLVSLTMSRTFMADAPTPIFAGVSLEAGNVWQDDSDISGESLITAGSLFAGIETFVGPVYLAWGMAEGGRRAVYLYLGNPFLNRSNRVLD